MDVILADVGGALPVQWQLSCPVPELSSAEPSQALLAET